jgi:chemosensory pili system protein ChpA (sensor histidine kinase/response regulator)
VVQTLAALATPPAPPAAMPAPAPAGDDDDDMREIFLEEAREVLEQAREVWPACARTPPISRP